MGLKIPDYREEGLNHNYGYAKQNPLMYIDETGELSISYGMSKLRGHIARETGVDPQRAAEDAFDSAADYSNCVTSCTFSAAVGEGVTRGG